MIVGRQNKNNKMHHMSSTLITQLDPNNQTQSFPQIDNLATLKNEILHKMQLLDSLNVTFKQKNQISFLKTFRKIMNNLSEQLKNAVEAYQNIDQEISTDPKCVLLTKQAHFYQTQREVLQSQYEQELSRLNQLKLKNQQLKLKRNHLKAKSLLSQQKIVKYTDKSNTMSLRFGQLLDNSQDTNHPHQKRATESTKYHTSADKSRVPSFNSVNRRAFFDNVELQDDKTSKRKNKSLSRKRFSKVLTSENVSPFRLNNFF